MKHKRMPIEALARLRRQERVVRKHTLAFTRWGARLGYRVAETAEVLGLKPCTLTKWEKDWRTDRLQPATLGRPRARLSYEAFETVTALFTISGPVLSLDVLRSLFPFEAPAALEEYRHFLSKLAKRQEKLSLQTLNWMRSGAVWAMDIFYPPKPIDGQFPYVLVVRDLATGCNLLAQPLPNREMTGIVQALEFLFGTLPKPLVLKSDNEFDADLFAQCLQRHKVFHLLSPPQFPRYNGAAEAGIGSLKTRTFFEAARNNRPCDWTCDDLEAGRCRINELSRPKGFLVSSPEEAFRHVRPITQTTWDSFALAVENFKVEARKRLGLLEKLVEQDALSRSDRNAVLRLALALALVDQGFLSVRRKRFSPPFPLRFS